MEPIRLGTLREITLTLPPMHTFIAKPTLDDLKPLRKILPRDWHKFGVEYRSVQTDSSGFATGGQLHDGRRFTWNNLENRYKFTK